MLKLVSALWLAAVPAAAQESGTLRYTPPSQTFACDLPNADWHGFEEEEGAGFAVHLLGPDNPNGTYRSGIDIRWIEKGQPGWMPLKRYIDDLRGGDGRGATSVRPYRVNGMLARTFEVVEARRLPADQVPSVEDDLHDYYAVIPVGESYFSIKLTSTRDVYLDFRPLFVKFLHTFKPMGAGKY